MIKHWIIHPSHDVGVYVSLSREVVCKHCGKKDKFSLEIHPLENECENKND